MEKRVGEELNEVLEKGVERCENVYKSEIGKQLNKVKCLFEGRKDRDMFGEEIQKIRVELDENKKISSEKLEKLKLEVKEKNKKIQRLEELVNNKSAEIQLLYKQLENIKLHPE